MNRLYMYGIQVLFVASIAIGSQSLDDKLKWLYVARYLVYLLTIQSVPHLCQITHKYYTTRHINLRELFEEGKEYVIVYLISLASLVYFGRSVFEAEFVYVAAAYLAAKYPQMVRSSLVDIVTWLKKPSINYGVGMACSFFEGYLTHILPSDGANFVGFEENIRSLEDHQGILFPVKKLFIIITKNLYCPPDLKEFNKGDGYPKLESFNLLDDVVKNVAGVKNRIYRNTAYKVYRARGPPVCLAAECATPLHTLHKVLEKRTLYREVANIDVGGVVRDFCNTLRTVLDASPQCRGKCELIYYDNEDPKQNLADILVARVRELVPDFEEQILAREQMNHLEQEN